MAADDAVVAVVAVDLIVIDTRVDRIVARTAVDGVRVVAGADRIVAAAAIDKITTIVLVRIAGVEEWVGSSTDGRLIIRIIREGVDTRFDQIVTVTAIDFVGTLDIGDGVVAATAIDGVVVDAAFDDIIIVATVDIVGIITAIDRIIPRAADQRVFVVVGVGILIKGFGDQWNVRVGHANRTGLVADQDVVTLTTDEGVVAVTTDQAVIIFTTVDGIIAALAIDGIITTAGVHHVVAVTGQDIFIAAGACNRIVTATQFESLDLREFGGAGPVGQCPFLFVGESDRQIIIHGRTVDDIAVGFAAFAADDNVIVDAIGQCERVVARPAVNGIVAQPAVDRVVATVAKDRIVDPVGAVDLVALGVGVARCHILATVQTINRTGHLFADDVFDLGEFERARGCAVVVVQINRTVLTIAVAIWFQITQAEIEASQIKRVIVGVQRRVGIEAAGTTVNRIAIGAAKDGILARAAADLVFAFAASELVITVAADQRIVIIAAKQRVIACAAVDQIIAVVAH